MLVPRRQTKWPCSCCANTVANHLTPSLSNHPWYIINKTTVISTQSCAVSTNICSSHGENRKPTLTINYRHPDWWSTTIKIASIFYTWPWELYVQRSCSFSGGLYDVVLRSRHFDQLDAWLHLQAMAVCVAERLSITNHRQTVFPFNRQLAWTHAADTRIVCHVQQSRFLSEIHSSEPQNITGPETPFNCLFGSDFVEIANTASSAGTPAAHLHCYKSFCVLWLADHRNEQYRRPISWQLWLGGRLVQTGACSEAGGSVCIVVEGAEILEGRAVTEAVLVL